MKRFIAMVLSVCIVLSLSPVSTVTAEPEVHTDHHACVCAISGGSCDGHGENAPLTWTAWDANASASYKTTLPTSGNYYLTEDVTLGANVTLSAEVKLCLNGYSIDLGGSGKYITNSGTLTIMNCKTVLNEKDQYVSGGRTDANSGRIYNGIATRAQAGAINSTGNLTLIGVEFYQNALTSSSDARSGGAIYMENAALNIQSCAFTENKALATNAATKIGGTGGAICFYKGGSVNIKDTLFTGNTAYNRGGALAVNTASASGETTVWIGGNSEFRGNTVTGTTYSTNFYNAGGAIYLRKNSSQALKVTICDNTVISGNSAKDEGGGIAMQNSSGTMELTVSGNVNISGNSSTTVPNTADICLNKTLILDGLSADASVNIGMTADAAIQDYLQVTQNQTEGTTGVFYHNQGKYVSYSQAGGFQLVEHTHHACICAISGGSCEGHGENAPQTWTAWTSTTSLPTSEGSYYLIGDVTLGALTEISANVKLCLNGHNIDLNGKKLVNTGDLTIMNCQATLNEKKQLTSENGKLYGGRNGSGADLKTYGGAIGSSGNVTLIGVLLTENICKANSDARTGGALYLEAGTATIQSCRFYQNTAIHTDNASNKNNGVGGAISVYKSGSLNIQDTVFEKNAAALYGGAIYVNNRYTTTDNSVMIGGNSVFTGNMTSSTSNGYGSALFLYAGSRVENTYTKHSLQVTIGGNTQITGNTAAKDGAVCLRSLSTNPIQAVVSGNVKISGNAAADAALANVHFYDADSKLTVGVLESAANVRIGTKEAVSDPDEILVAADNVTLTDTAATGIVYENNGMAVGYKAGAVKFTFNHAHYACSCALSGGAACGGHSDMEDWTPWTSTTTLPETTGNYYLTGNVTLTNTGKLKVGSEDGSVTENVNICLNGFDVTFNGANAVDSNYNVYAGSSLTVMNCKAKLDENGNLDTENTTGGTVTGGKGTKGGVILSDGSVKLIGVELSGNEAAPQYDGQGGGAILVQNGTAQILHCHISGNTTTMFGGAIAVYRNGDVTVTDTVFAGNTAAYGGAISVYSNAESTGSPSVTVNGNTRFTENSANNYGGAVYIWSRFNTKDGIVPQVTMDAAELSGNTAETGGAVSIRRDGKLTVKNAVISGNSAKNGGAIGLYYINTEAQDQKYVASPQVSIEKSRLTGNTATAEGGAVYIGWNAAAADGAKPQLTVSGSEITGNQAATNGGALYIRYADAAVSQSAISENAAANGGAIYVRHGKVTCTDSNILSNTAAKSGGAAMLSAGGALELDGCTVSKNRAEAGDGGAIRMWEAASAQLKDSKLTENTADSGAGISIFRGSSLTVSGGEISGNVAQKDGGGIYADTASTEAAPYEQVKITVTGGSISGNSAGNRGGGAYLVNADMTVSGGSIGTNSAKNGGAVYLYCNGSAVTDPQLTITGDAQVTGNKSTAEGGAIYVFRDAATAEALTPRLTVSGNAAITENQAGGNGGALFIWRQTSGIDPEVILSENAKISGNKAAGNGGGLYFNGQTGSATVSGNVVIYGNDAVVGDNIYFFTTAHKLKVGKLEGNAKLGVTTKDTLGVVDPDEFLETAKGVTLQDAENTGILFENTDPDKAVGYSTKGSEKFYFTIAKEQVHTDHGACACVLTNSSCTHTALTWKPWPYADRLPTTGNWYLTEDVNVANLSGGQDAVFEIEKGQKVNLCLNGFSVKFNEKNTTKSNYYAKAGSSLTVMNCQAKLDGQGQLNTQNATGGKLYGGNGSKGGVILSNGTLKLIGVELTGNKATPVPADLGKGGGAVYVQEGTADVQYCRFSKNSTERYGGAICVYRNGTLTVANSCFIENQAGYGGAISVYSNKESAAAPTLRLNANTRFENNQATSGGAVYLYRYETTKEGIAPRAIMTGAVFSGNTAKNNGGAVSVNGIAELTRIDATDCTFTGNTAEVGGAIHLHYGKIVANSTTVEKNTAVSGGGGVYGGYSEVTFQRESFITENKTEKSGGGGIYLNWGSSLRLYTCTVAKNQAPDGGGVRLWRNCTMELLGGKITENTASNSGGGISMFRGSTLTITSGQISKNVAEKTGGGIYADTSSTEKEPYAKCQLTMTDGTVSDNIAKTGEAGGIYVKNCDVTLTGGKITGNMAEAKNGGGITTSGQTSLILENVTITGNKAKLAGGILLQGAGSSLELRSGAVSKNEADTHAGGIYVSKNSKLTMTGGEVSNNTARNGAGIYQYLSEGIYSGGKVSGNKAVNGGGIYVREGKLTIEKDALITENYGDSGGGVVIQAKTELNMTGGSIEKNTAKNGGGIILWSQSVWNFTGGTVKGNKVDSNGGGAYLQAGATLNLKGGKFTANVAGREGGAFFAKTNDDNLTVVNVYSGTITGNKANQGGGAYIGKGARLNCYGGYWGSNEANVCGGAAYLWSSTGYFYGGTFQYNHVKDCGGAINGSSAKIILDGATITENIADARGGGLRLYYDCEFTMLSGTVSKNEAARGGGGIALYCSATISGGKITENKVTGSETYKKPIGGGGINVFEGSNVYKQRFYTVDITGGEISGNYSLTNGGGICFSGRTTLNVTGGSIINNTAEQLGGGIMVDNFHNPRASWAILNLTGGEISGNTATDGAGVHARYSADVRLDGATINGNTASGMGGALYLGRGTKGLLKDTLLTGNTAAEGAGFYAIDDFQMQNLEVSGNEAGDGHAVYIDRGEYDGESYVLGIIKMIGDIRICDNNGAKPDLFIGQDAKINIGYEGLGQNTRIDLELESGLLTNTVFGAYDYEGGDLQYVLTYGDRSLTELEYEAPAEETEPADTTEATQATEEKPSGEDVMLYAGVGAFAVVIAAIAVLVVILGRKKKKAEEAATEAAQE